MGDCYSATLHVKFKPHGKRDAANALRQYIREHDRKDCNFNLALVREKMGFTPDSWNGLVHIFLAAWRRGQADADANNERGFLHYHNDFDCSYGWGRVLNDFAETIAPFLADGSYFHVDADETHINLEVDDGDYTLN